MNSLPTHNANDQLSFNAQQNIGVPTEQPKKKGPCCVCKETKAVRDECIMRNGEEKCFDFIQAHKACLRSEGFGAN